MATKRVVPHLALIEEWVADMKKDPDIIWECKFAGGEWTPMRSEPAPRWSKHMEYRRAPKVEASKPERPFLIVLCETDGNYVFSLKSSKWETKDAFIIRLNALGYKIKSKFRKTSL